MSRHVEGVVLFSKAPTSEAKSNVIFATTFVYTFKEKSWHGAENETRKTPRTTVVGIDVVLIGRDHTTDLVFTESGIQVYTACPKERDALDQWPR